MNRTEKTYGEVKVVKENGKYGVEDLEGNTIVPFGKYDWIDGFDSGLARVRTKKGSDVFVEKWLLSLRLRREGKNNDDDVINDIINKDKRSNPGKYTQWGIIDKSGKEVLPVEYDAIWNFKNKNRNSTTAFKDGVRGRIYFSDLKTDQDPFISNDCNNHYGYFDSWNNSDYSIEDSLYDALDGCSEMLSNLPDYDA